jgi:hypothetical protein
MLVKLSNLIHIYNPLECYYKLIQSSIITNVLYELD